MHPTIDPLGLTIKTWPLMVTLGFAAALVVLARAARERELPASWVPEGTTVALVCGLVGARLWTILAGDGGARELLSAGAGFTWYGGLVGGAVGVALWGRLRRVPPLVAADGAAVALPIGQALGRIGCHLSGDGDYGRPTDLPWAMSYADGVIPTPPGVEVHPAPLYEAFALLAIFVLLWRLRHALRDGALAALYLLLAGTQRLLVETIRLNDDALLGLTLAQLVSVAAMTAGAAWVVVLSRTGAIRRNP